MSSQLLIYTSSLSPRLQYTIEVVAERLGLEVGITTDIAKANAGNIPIINYSTENIVDSINIIPSDFIFESSIHPLSLNIHRWKRSTIIFYNQPGALVPFDIFGAIFYLLSRYEEYLPYTQDKHGRYPASSSVAMQYSFIQYPVVDIWINELGKILKDKWNINCKSNSLSILTTFDIDLLWKYQGKAWYKKLMMKFFYFLKNKNKEIKSKGDPYFCFESIIQLLKKKNTASIFFVLNPSRKSKYDRIIPKEENEFIDILKKISINHNIGIHPSYYSNLKDDIISNEKNALKSIVNRPIVVSRQHYIKLDIPKTYRMLIDSNITDDYTMGYPEVNGFRASTCFSFPWYDLENDQKTKLTIHPFAFMDATSIFYNRDNSNDANKELVKLYENCTLTGGEFCMIWHNYIVGDKAMHPGYWELMETFIDKNDYQKLMD